MAVDLAGVDHQRELDTLKGCLDREAFEIKVLGKPLESFEKVSSCGKV